MAQEALVDVDALLEEAWQTRNTIVINQEI